ncbi:MAG: HAD family hydrolase, partial [Planctomycetota bacterium]
ADSKEVLVQLSQKYTLALLTDGFLPAQELKVQALGIEKYFKCIMYTERLGRQFWQLSAVGFEKLLEKLDCESQMAVYVADNELKDFIAPNKLGFVTIQIIRLGRIHTASSDQPLAAAKHKIGKIGQLPALLESL